MYLFLFFFRSITKKWIISILVAIAVLAIIGGIFIGLHFGNNNNSEQHTGAVVANGFECAEIGRYTH